MQGLERLFWGWADGISAQQNGWRIEAIVVKDGMATNLWLSSRIEI
jgi:hypothetical protein